MLAITEEEILARCAPFTMTSIERQRQTLWCVEKAAREEVAGDFVEIGVWRGGSVMLMLYKLLQLGVTDRDVHLYDTFEGMTDACDLDVDVSGRKASDMMHLAIVKAEASYEDVRANIQSVGYPMERVHFHVGDIREVAMADIPDRISVLRIDNDWHELYAFELPLFVPRVSPGGVVTIDDYGWWNGCKIAVDSFLSQQKNAPALQQIDGVGVFWVVPHSPH